MRPDVIESVMGEPAVATPIRAYVGLESAPTEDERVALAMAELERTGAFERSWVMFASPTGTGYVNYAAVGALECLTRGDCATLAMQYSSRPSVLSLDRVDEGRQHAGKLITAIGARLAAIPRNADRSSSSSARASARGPARTRSWIGAPRGSSTHGVDHAIWIGTPYLSKWKDQVLHETGPDIDRSLVGVFDNIGEWDALPTAEREAIRYVMITHQDDGVALFGPDGSSGRPTGSARRRPAPVGVPKGMRWTPTGRSSRGSST